jgi:hypothetical protein
LLVLAGAGPVDGMLLVPDCPLPGPPGVLAMVGLLFGLVWFIWVPEVEPPAGEVLLEPEPIDELEPELIVEPEPVAPVDEDEPILPEPVEEQAPSTKTAARGMIHLFIYRSSEN